MGAMASALSRMLMQPPPNPAGAPPMAPPNSLGVGAPPMPGLPPPPEMVGQMPTGSTANNAKQAADVAISALRDLKGYYPSLNDAIDGLTSQVQAAAQQAANVPAPQVGTPGGPGAALPTVSPTTASGTPGTV